MDLIVQYLVRIEYKRELRDSNEKRAWRFITCKNSVTTVSIVATSVVTNTTVSEEKKYCFVYVIYYVFDILL